MWRGGGCRWGGSLCGGLTGGMRDVGIPVHCREPSEHLAFRCGLQRKGRQNCEITKGKYSMDQPGSFKNAVTIKMMITIIVL